MVFHCHRKKRKYLGNIGLHIDDMEIKETLSIKYFRVIIDAKLNWVSALLKIAKRIGIIKKARPFINKSSLSNFITTLYIHIEINSRKPTGSFRFSTHTLEEVDSFKYLGVTFCDNGSFIQAQENIACQTRRAQASLDYYIMQHNHLSVNVIFKIFDKLIKPILLYGSEIIF